MLFKKHFFLFVCFLMSLQVFGGHVKGFVTNMNDSPLPFASVFISGTTIGTATNFVTTALLRRFR